MYWDFHGARQTPAATTAQWVTIQHDRHTTQHSEIEKKTLILI